jgi:hypothetical protein
VVEPLQPEQEVLARGERQRIREGDEPAVPALFGGRGLGHERERVGEPALADAVPDRPERRRLAQEAVALARREQEVPAGVPPQVEDERNAAGETGERLVEASSLP